MINIFKNICVLQLRDLKPYFIFAYSVTLAAAEHLNHTNIMLVEFSLFKYPVAGSKPSDCIVGGAICCSQLLDPATGFLFDFHGWLDKNS